MLENAFAQVYGKFKLHFYIKIFDKLGDREASLTSTETFCMEIIQALGAPTILEFAKFADFSAPNAAYKVNNLIQKGYLIKEQSKMDRREFHIKPTQKYYDYYNISHSYITSVIDRIKNRFTQEECNKFEEMLNVISDELMPEIPLKLNLDGTELTVNNK